MQGLRHAGRYVRRHGLGLVALFLALTASGYAAAKFDSGDVANKSLKGKDVKPASLGGKQVKDEKLTGVDIDESDLTSTHITARLRDSTDRTIPRATPVAQYGTVGPWTQRPDEVNEVIGQGLVSFPAGCNPARVVQVFLVRPGSNFPTTTSGVAAAGFAQSGVAGAQTVPFVLTAGVFPVPTVDADQFEPGVDTTRALNVFAQSSCGGGSTADPVITDINLDVIGHR